MFQKALFAVIALGILSCGQNTQNSSDPSFNVDYRITAGIIKKSAFLKSTLKTLLSANSSTAPALKAADLILFDLSGSEYQAIAKAYPKPAKIVCNKAKRKCRGTVQGRGVKTKLSLVSEADKMAMGSAIQVSLRMITSQGRDYVEVCRASGIQFQKLFMWAPLDGFLLRFTKADANRIDKLVVDLGAGGSYPTAKCDF